MGRIGQKLKRLSISMALTAIVAVIGAFGVSAYDANTNLIKKYEQSTKVTGTVNVGIYGSYINDITNAINRVNAIRKEACDQGVWDPRNPSRKLTSSDYVPIKWSYELEETARLRAAEAAFNIDHTRPNGLSCFSVEFGLNSSGEVLAWNWNKDMVSGINQFYAEKSDWVNKTANAVTGHYTQMIDPSNTYMGLGCFYSNSKVIYPNTLCGRFSRSTSTSINTSRGSAISNCYVPVQVPTTKLTGASLKLVSGKAALRTGESASYELWANAYYYMNTDVLLYEATWKSSNTAVATVDKYGKITGVGAGTATITATCGGLSKSVTVTVKEVINVSKCTISLSGTSFTYTGSAITPTVTVKYAGTTLKNGTDYTIAYKANTNAGTATVTITGIEDYNGTVSKTFVINPKSITGFSFTLSPTAYTYDGKAKTPAVTVKNGSTALKSGTDYTVAYKNNTQVGTGTVTVTGKGNYAGTKSLSFSIYPYYERIAGNNRYLTAVEISKKSYPTTADTVLIASGENYADALAGVPLAKAYKAPLLLVSKDRILNETLNEITRLKAKTAIILGGNGAVSKSVEDKIKAKGLKIERLDGSTRFETAAMIAQKLADKTSAPKSVFFVYYNDFPDALSVSSVAALQGSPVLYVKTSGEVDEYTKQFINKYKSNIQNAYIIGGTGVISNGMSDKIKNCVGKTPVRVAGQNRYETCVAVNKQFASLFTGTAICVATGKQFPDALAGGVFAALQGSPIFLADQVLYDAQSSYLKTKAPVKLWVLGGTAAVPNTLIQTIKTKCV